MTQPRNQRNALRYGQPGSGSITGTACIDLTAITNHHDQRFAVSGLTTFRGFEVLIRVGSLSPHAVNIDVPHFLAEAAVAGTSLRFEGDPSSVGEWIRSVRCIVGAMEQHQRLRVVQS